MHEQGAHKEHGSKVCDARHVEAQRLVERRRVLPSVERRAYGAGARCGMGGGRGATVQRAGKGPTAQIGSTRHGVERTSNMLCVVVTLEVLKLSGWLNADAPLNMKPIAVTLEVSKLSGWLNADA